MKRIVFFVALFSLPLHAFDPRIINQNQTSVIHIPVKYSFQELAASVNRHFQIEKKGVICEDNSFTNNNNDNFKVICHQMSNIKVSSEEGKVVTEVEVRINADFLINYHLKLDLWLFAIDRMITMERPMEFTLYVKFVTSLTIDKDLSPKVKTDWSYEWLSLPFISFGPISFRVLEETAPKVTGVIDTYAQNKIDKTILEKVDINQILYEVWDTFEEPIQISEDYNLWNFFRLKQIDSGGVRIDKEEFIFPFQVFLNNYTGFGSNSIDSPELLLNEVPSGFTRSNLSFTNNRFYMQMPLKMTVSDMEKMIFNEISTKDYIYGTGNLQVKVTEVYLSIEKNFIVSEVYLRSVSGTSFLGGLVLRITFNPFFDINQKKLRARYLTYQIVRSDTLLVDIVNAMQRDGFARTLQDAIVLEFDTYVESTHKLLNEKLNRYEFNEKLLFHTEIDTVDIKNVIIRGQELYAIVDLTGSVDLYLRNLF